MAARAKRRPRDADALVEALLQSAEKPLSTYEIRDRLDACGERLSIPLVYRAVSRLVEGKRIRRVESLSAYTPGQAGNDALVVCTHCSRVTPVPLAALIEQIAATIRDQNFVVEDVIIEVQARCPLCTRDNSKSSGNELLHSPISRAS